MAAVVSWPPRSGSLAAATQGQGRSARRGPRRSCRSAPRFRATVRSERQSNLAGLADPAGRAPGDEARSYGLHQHAHGADTRAAVETLPPCIRGEVDVTGKHAIRSGAFGRDVVSAGNPATEPQAAERPASSIRHSVVPTTYRFTTLVRLQALLHPRLRLRTFTAPTGIAVEHVETAVPVRTWKRENL